MPIIRMDESATDGSIDDMSLQPGPEPVAGGTMKTCSEAGTDVRFYLVRSITKKDNQNYEAVVERIDPPADQARLPVAHYLEQRGN